MVSEIHYVDYGALGEYGFFGKVVARSDVRGMDTWQIKVEVAEMLTILGNHIVPLTVEVLPAITEEVPNDV